VNPLEQAWFDANLIAILLAINPRGLKGVSVKSQFGPIRDSWLNYFMNLLPADSKVVKAPANLSPEQLFGSLDIESALLSGKFKVSQGLLERLGGQYLLLPMAERMNLQVITHISQALDEKNLFNYPHAANNHPFGVIVFDESEFQEEGVNLRLLDRLAFGIYLDRFSINDTKKYLEVTPSDIKDAIALLPSVTCSQDLIEVLIKAGLSLGISSLRANQFVLEAAKSLAALRGLMRVGQQEAIDAARLVYTHLKSMQAPPEEGLDNKTDDSEDVDGNQESQHNSDNELSKDEETSDLENINPPSSADELEELVVEAIQASLPPKFMMRMNQTLRPTKTKASITGKSGSIEKSFASGRPHGARKGLPGNGRRLDILKSIRSAIPWQRLRAQQNNAFLKSDNESKIHFRAEDLHTKQYLKRRGTITIFLVDASGSSATQRLSEAKGAVEELLSQCYIRRDEVAMLSMRGSKVDIILPPTRSLVRAKRNLATLPGGGGTPLALGLRSANEMASSSERKGLTPIIVIMTDGKANVNLSGVGGRAGAHNDAITAAKELSIKSHRILFVDTSPQPEKLAQELAGVMAAQYFPLPYTGSRKKITAAAIQLANF
jgi:magnesium chelatase subunit D